MGNSFIRVVRGLFPGEHKPACSMERKLIAWEHVRKSAAILLSRRQSRSQSHHLTENDLQEDKIISRYVQTRQIWYICHGRRMNLLGEHNDAQCEFAVRRRN